MWWSHALFSLLFFFLFSLHRPVTIYGTNEGASFKLVASYATLMTCKEERETPVPR